MSARLQDKVVVVTGAAAGIGRAVAQGVVEQGGSVIAVDLHAERLASLEQILPGIVTVVADLTDTTAIEAVAQAATAAGGADALVNNAGIMDGFVPLGEVADELWERVMAVNVTAPMRLTRALLPAMVEAGSGTIVNVASIGGLTGGAAGTAYTASKHALVGMTRSLAFLYGPQGVRSNAVCPGGVSTSIAESGGVPEVEWAWQRVEQGLGRAQRQAESPEIASLVLYLLGDDAINVNGSIIASDGGWTAA